MILKHGFNENNIKYKRLKITKKKLIYSLIFSIGYVRITKRSEVFKDLSNHHSYKNIIR